MKGRINTWITASGALAVVAVALLMPPPEAGNSYVYSANGYTDTVNNILAREGWIEFEEGRNNEPPVVHVAPVTELDTEVNREVQSFLRNSYLRRDIHHSEFWVIHKGRLTIDRNAHNVSLPLSPSPIWAGNLHFRQAGEISAVLGGPSETTLRTIWRYQPADSDVVQCDIRATDAGLTGTRLDFRVGGEKRCASGQHIGGADVARVMLIGDNLFVRVMPSSPVGVLVDGNPLLEGFQVLPPGADLKFDDHVSAPVSYISRGEVGGSAFISRYEPLVGRLRDRSSAHPMMNILAGQFDDAMNGAARAIDQNKSLTPKARAAGLAALNADVVTSLDVDLQSKLQEALEAYAETGRSGGAGFPAAALVMDATDGEILAMASYPASIREGRDTNAAWEKNWNFYPLLIGSAAKPVLASAIIERWPDLWSLHLPAYSNTEFDNVMGLKFSVPCDQKPNDCLGEAESFNFPNGVDFNTFIQHSSNKYATSLMLLAASRDPFGIDRTRSVTGAKPTDRYTLSGRMPDFLPKLELEQDNRLITITSKLDWLQELSLLFDLDTEVTRNAIPDSVYDDDSYDKSIWSSLIAGFPQGTALTSADFRQPSPQRVNLNLNNAQSLRNDYLTVILGGATSRWTTMKLAEAYARIITGQRLVARLTKAGPEPEGMTACNTIPDGKFCGRTRQRMLDAMSLVSVGGGTAGELEPVVQSLAAEAARHNQDLGFFSKTGTPELPQILHSVESRAIARLGEDRILRVNPHTAQIEIALPGRIYPVGTARERNAAMSAMHDDRLVFQAIDNDDAVLRLVVRRILKYNTTHRALDRSALISVSNGAVTGIPAAYGAHPTFGKVYAFVVGIYPRGSAVTVNAPNPRDSALAHDVRETAQPTRAFAVVVNFQKNWVLNGSKFNRAADMSRQIIEYLRPILWPEDARQIEARTK